MMEYQEYILLPSYLWGEITLKGLYYKQHLSSFHKRADKCLINGGLTDGTPTGHENGDSKTPV